MTFFIVSIDRDGASAEELEEASRSLADDLLEVPDLKIGRVVDPTPTAGTRSIVYDAPAALVVSWVGLRMVATSPKAENVSKLILGVFQSFFARNPGTQLKYESPEGASLTMTGGPEVAEVATAIAQQLVPQQTPAPEAIELPQERTLHEDR